MFEKSDSIVNKWIKVPQDPTQAPEGYKWVGPGEQGTKEGSYLNPDTNEGLRPDLDHDLPQGPHWDYKSGKGEGFNYRVPPSGGNPVPK